MFTFFDFSNFLETDRGSFIVAGAFFMMIFMMIGACAVDLSRYFLRQQTAQQIADGAALAGANSLNQVRTLDDIDQEAVLRTTLNYIKSHSPNTAGAGSYDTAVYEYSAEMTPGESDIQFDSFPATPTSDTFYRVGVNVKTTWKPYFLPIELFGRYTHRINATAVAEAHPQFRNVTEPGEAQRAWGSGMYSRDGQIQFNGIDGNLDLNTDVCSRNGQVQIQEIGEDGSGYFHLEGDIRAEGGQVQIQNMDNADSIYMEGDITSGNGDISVGAPADNEFHGNWFANNGSISSSDTVTHHGDENSDGDQLTDAEKQCGNGAPPSIPDPTCSNVSDSYGLDIDEDTCGGAGPDGTCDADATFIVCNKTRDAVDELGNDIHLDNQMLHIDNGQLHLESSGSDNIHNIDGNGQLISKGQVHLNNGPSLDGEIDVISLNNQIHLNNIDDPTTLQGNLIAPNGQIHFNNVNDEVDLEGSIYSESGQLKFNNMSGDLSFESENFCSIDKDTALCDIPPTQVREPWAYAWNIFLIS